MTIDPDGRLLRYSNAMRVAVAIRRGEQFAEISEFGEALKEFQKALETNRNSSLAHYRIAEVFFLQNNYQSAANEFREALNGDLEPKWTEVWSHINLGKIFDITGQRERAVNEYQLAQRTRDNTQGAQDEVAKYLKKPYERQQSRRRVVPHVRRIALVRAGRSDSAGRDSRRATPWPAAPVRGLRPSRRACGSSRPAGPRPDCPLAPAAAAFLRGGRRALVTLFIGWPAIVGAGSSVGCSSLIVSGLPPRARPADGIPRPGTP